jgi:hypothetical protein
VQTPKSYDTKTWPSGVGLVSADPGDGQPGPLVWQRTDTVGTELVMHHGGAGRLTAAGSAVVAGALPHIIGWEADLEPSWAVRALTVTCRGAGWSRTLWLRRDAAGSWTCRTEATGDLNEMPPGIDDPDRLDSTAPVRLSDWPIFLLGAAPAAFDAGQRTGVRTDGADLHAVADAATRNGHVPPARRPSDAGQRQRTVHSYDLDNAGIVTYRSGRFRLVH